MRDPYAVLGISRQAGTAEIKAAYRKLAKRWHPDRHLGDADARARFVEINEAYQELDGNSRRQAYEKPAARPRGAKASRKPATASGTDAADHDDMMERIFGVMPERTRVDDTPGIEMPPEDLPDETATGKPEDGKDARKSGSSHGRTVLLALNALFGRRGGHGRDQAEDADAEPQTIEVAVPLSTIISGGTVEAPLPDGTARSIEIAPGAADGARITLTPASRGAATEAIVRHVVSDALWSAGADLHATLAIDLDTAVLGGRKTFATLDGQILLTVPAWSGSDRTLRVAGRGLPKPDGTRGALFVHLRVLLPENPDERIVDLFKARKEGFYV